MQYIETLQKIFDLQNNILMVTDGNSPVKINKAFINFYGIDNINNFKNMIGCICNSFEHDDKFFHLGKVPKNYNWLDYIMTLSEIDKKVAIKSAKNIRHIFDIGVVKLDHKAFVVSLTDISETVNEKHMFEHLVNFDNLTQAYTRTFFTNNIKRIIHEIAVTNNLLVGIAIFDVDNFKKVNDTYGHDIGDKVLKNIVNSVKNSIRRDDFLIRWGGEEFLLIMAVSNINELFNIIDQTRINISNMLTDDFLIVTASFGISICQNLSFIEQCIKTSDEALYLAKSNGKNRVEIK